MYDKFVTARSQYAYPPIGLRAIAALGDVADWETSYVKVDLKTTLQLDLHHNSHLRSKSDDEVLLGIYSTMYWGYITSGAKSVIRCNWLSIGNAKSASNSLAGLGKSKAVDIVRTASSLLDAGSYGNALLEIRQLPHVGNSFGSKLLAFIDPENVGVLDEKISRHLASGSYSNMFSSKTTEQLAKPLAGSVKRAINRFQVFCESLNQIKIELNKSKCGWIDSSGAEMCRFRALDVERALFAIAKSIDNI